MKRRPFVRALGCLSVAVLAAAGTAAAQDTKIRGFTDVFVTASDAPGTSWAFGLGQLDIYITSRLADHWSFLSETVFEFDGDFVSDVERLIVTYRRNERFEVSAGKQHTPFGYWNTAFHHGALIQPSIERPLVFRFEDDGGPLPVHTTGVMIAGRDIGAAHLGYDVMLGNGIGGSPVSDNNPAKSLTIAAHTQITAALRFGASFYHDRIADGTPSLSGTPLTEALTRNMGGAYVVYQGSHFEVLAEYQRATNEGTVSGSRGSDLYYAHAGYRYGAVVPYAQYNELHFATGDPYLDLPRQRQGILGVRYDIAATTALKLEFHRIRQGAGSWVNEIAGQLAVGY